MLGISYVRNEGRLGCGSIGMFGVQIRVAWDVEYSRCEMFSMWEIECGMLMMWDLQGVECSGCGMFEISDVRYLLG